MIQEDQMDDGSDDEDSSDDDEEGDDDTDREEEEETMSEVSEETEMSGGIYDFKGRRVNMEEIIEEWQNRERDRKPVKIIRGPRGHRGPRGRQGPKGHRGKSWTCREFYRLQQYQEWEQP